jgi:hypothetical protein
MFNPAMCGMTPSNDFPSLPQGVVDAAAGIGDLLSLNLTSVIRQGMGTSDAVDKCSASYTGGRIAGAAVAATLGYGLIAAGAAAGSTAETLYLTAKLALGAQTLEQLTVAEELLQAELETVIEMSADSSAERTVDIINAIAKTIPKGPVIW